MPLQTLSSRLPPLFHRGPTLLARLGLAVAMAVFLMAADNRFALVVQARALVATALAPLQWLGAQPVKAVNLLGEYVTTVESAQQTREQAAIHVAQTALKAQRGELLMQENARLRALLGLSAQLPINARAAEVGRIASDPFTHTLVIDKGSQQGVQPGSPVIDEFGLLGQVVRVYPFSSEVALLSRPSQVTPVLNLRTGERSLAYGDSRDTRTYALELRFMAANADVKLADALVTSGSGGVYPAGLPVGSVTLVERRNNAAFPRIEVKPSAHTQSAGFVLVLDPVPAPALQADAPEAPGAPKRSTP